SALLEEWIAEAVLYRLDSPAMTEALTPAQDDTEAAALRKKVVALRHRQEELADMYATGEVDRAGWSRASSKISTELRRHESSLASMTRRSVAEPYIGKGEELRAQWSEMNLDRQVAIVKAVLNSVTILPATTPGRHGLDPARVRPDWRL
ncbi:recombinase family protein, partial [Georgenia sp. 10Sc9-8]|nr:recombinase family protein [Georgenia halotolerans]